MMVTMDKLKTSVASESVITSQVLNAEHQADPKITGNIELVGARTEPPQNLVRTFVSSMQLFQSFQWEPLWAHSN